MTLLVLLTIFYIILIIFDLTPIYLNKQWKVLGVYLTMLVVSYVIQVLLIFDVKVPTPADPIKRIVVFVFGL